MAKSRNASKWFMTAIVGLMVVAMGGFGLTDIVGGSSSTAAVSVGKTDIDINDYNQNYQSAIATVAQQQQRQISSSEARLLGLPNQITQRMVQVASISETARLAGIEISDSEIASQIAAIPAFQDADGKVDPARFNNYLNTNQISEKEFVKSMRSDAKTDVVVRALTQLSPELNLIKSELNNKFGEARSAVYLAYGFDDIGTSLVEPTDADLQAFYDNNTNNYHGDPARDVQVAYMLPEASNVSESELRTLYDNDLERYTIPATIPEYYMLSFANLEEAQKVTNLEELKALAAERSLNEEDFLFKDELVKNLPSAIGSEIIAGGAGFYGPIEGALGYTVYSVTSVTPEEVQSFEDVKTSIAEGIAYDAMNEKFNAVQDQVLDLIAGGVKPEDIAKEAGLTFAAINTGNDSIAGLTDDDAFKEELSAASIDEERDLISLSTGGVAIIRVVAESPAEVLAYDKVKDRVKTDFITNEKTTALDAFHDKLVAQTDAGKSIEDLATEFNLQLTSTKPTPRQAAISEMPLPIAFELFSKEIGAVWDIADQDKHYLVRANEAVAFDASDAKNADFIAQNNSQVDALVGDVLLNDFTNGVATELKASINPAIIEQVVGVDAQ